MGVVTVNTVPFAINILFGPPSSSLLQCAIITVGIVKT